MNKTARFCPCAPWKMSKKNCLYKCWMWRVGCLTCSQEIVSNVFNSLTCEIWLEGEFGIWFLRGLKRFYFEEISIFFCCCWSLWSTFVVFWGNVGFVILNKYILSSGGSIGSFWYEKLLFDFKKNSINFRHKINITWKLILEPIRMKFLLDQLVYTQKCVYQ